MTMYSADGEWDHPCEVRIDSNQIIVSYEDAGSFVVYEGSQLEPGHFKLHSKSVNGRATLHRFENDDTLEGFWIEERMQGMWRVQLDE